MPPLPQTCVTGTPLMPEIVADLPDPSCSRLFSESEIQESQSLGPDSFVPRARDRLAEGGSRNPGTPHPHPKRRG
jgi:hypothetical protein